MKRVLLLSAYLTAYCNGFTVPSINTYKIRNRSTISNILLNERRTIDINVDVNVDVKTQTMLSQINNTSSSSSHNTRYTNGQQTSASISITRRDDSSINLPIICNAQQQKAYRSELSYVTNFTKTIHDIVIRYFMSSSSTIVDLPLQYFEFQWQNNLATPSSISADTNTNNNVSTNYGVLDLIKSLITAKNEQQIDNTLAIDFTTADATTLSVGESAGIGCGLQIYRKGKLVLTVGGGGGGGCISSSEEGYECGGGGGASIFLPDSNSDMARVGGGHGMQDGYETEHNPTLFIEQLQILRDILTNDSNLNGIAILGGGGGGSGYTNDDNTSSSNGRGYGFGFEIGSIEGINLAKKMMSRRSNNEASGTGSDDNRNPLNLPDHLLNEEWAAQVAEYIDPPENEKEEEFQARAKL